MIDLDVVLSVIILLTYSLDLMQQRRNWLKPLQYLQDCLSKQLFIENHKVTGQNVDIYTFQMILQFVVKAFEEESSLLYLNRNFIFREIYKIVLH